MNSILKIFDPISKTWKGVSAIKGETGKSAYQLAVESGYKGTEAQFKAEQASIANNSARLTAVEQNKVNLVEGFVSPNEIDLLQGKQTGVLLKGNAYYSAPLSQEGAQMLTHGDYSIECYYYYEPKSTTAGFTYPMFHISNTISVYRQSDTITAFQLVNKRGDGSLERTNITSTVKGGFMHLVLTIDRTNKEFSGYLNAIKFNAKSFAESISLETNLKMVIGDNNTNNAAQEFTAYHCRVFNHALSPEGVSRLYDARNSDNYESIYNDTPDKRCVYEFKPNGVTLTQWRDTLCRLNLNGAGFIENRKLTYPKYSGSPMTPLFVARGAVFNRTTGFYELNGLTDITEEQMIDIYTQTSTSFSVPFCCERYAHNTFRTSYEWYPKGVGGQYMGNVNCTAMFYCCRRVEIINVGILYAKVYNYMFIYCTALETISGDLNFRNATSSIGMFKNCPVIKNISIKEIKINLDIKDSPLLSRDSIVYLITNAANTTPITVTLHPDALARLTEADIALASSKNITIA